MISVQTRALLLGKDRHTSKLWIVTAIALFIASLLYFAALNAFTGYRWSVHLFLWWEGYAAILGAFIVAQAYTNDGLIISWALAFAAILGNILNYGGIGLTGRPPDLLKLIGLALVGAFLGATLLGTLGFIIGATTQRLTR